MLDLVKLIRSALLACVILQCPSPARGAAASVTTQPESFRAVYLRFSDLFDARQDPPARLKSMRAELDRMKACGLNTILPYATDTSGRALYPSKLIPERVYGDWDSLGALVAEARLRGLRVYPVHCPLPSGGERPAGILLKHPEWALRSKNGQPMGHISPVNPEARKWVASVSEELVSRYQPEGLLLDYLRFPSATVQLGDTPAGGPALTGKALQSLKEESLTETARLISEGARRAKPDLHIALYSWGPQVATNHNVAQNWPLWAQRGYIDMVNASGYCFTNNYGARYLDEFSKRLGKTSQILRGVGKRTELTFALGIKTSHGQIGRAAEVQDYLRLARTAGANGFAAFTWGYIKPFYSEIAAAGYFKE